MARRQFIVEVIHPSRANVAKSDLAEKLAALYKTDKERIVTFGFRTQFGGGRSCGFALIYDDEESQKKFEPRYRLVRVSVPISRPARLSLFVDGEITSLGWARRRKGQHENCGRNERTVPRR